MQRTCERASIFVDSKTWSPHTDRDVNKIEQVQINAARFVKNDYNPYTSTSGLVSPLSWVSLEHRRLLAQASATRFNLNKYKQLNSNVLSYSYSFFPRTVRNWNCLPTSVVSAPNIKEFKSSALLCIPNIRRYHICDDPKTADRPLEY